MNAIVESVSGILYTYILVILLVLGGLYFTIRTKGAQFRLLGEQVKSVTEKSKDGKVSSFQALMVSTASRVGTGNIAGVAAAICLGGFGSIFWMWIIALIGGASAFVESTLAQIYKRKGKDGGCYGGPAYYIETAFKKRKWARPLAIAFSIFLILTYGVGFNMVASFNLQSSFTFFDFYNPDITPWIIGGIVAFFVALCLFGGGKRIIKTTSLLVPVMGIAYILIALIVILLNIGTIPAVFGEIFRSAFDFKAIFGGFTGSCIMLGVKRGLFSNEAGVGSAPNASASAEVAHPVKQGLVQILSVFIDTLVICTATAFMCMTSGAELATSSGEALSYVQSALAATLGGFGPIFILVAMILFAFTTLLGNLFYVDKAVLHIMGKEPGKKFKVVYNVVASLLVFVGAGLSADLLWNLADIFMGLMVIINIPVIFVLGKYAFRALKDYENQRKEGKDPVFVASDVGLDGNDLDFWKE